MEPSDQEQDVSTPRSDRKQDLRNIGRDPDAFEAFYRRHVEAVQRFVARRVTDAHRAADLTAEVFVAVIESADTYRPGRGDPVAWLYGVARNVVAADRRRNAREHRAYARIAGHALVNTDDIARIEERIAAEQRARPLLRALEALPDHERAVMELVAIDGLSTTRAAQALGISRVAAAMRLMRAKRAMRETVTPQVAGRIVELSKEAQP